MFYYVRYPYCFTIYDPVTLNACPLNLTNTGTGISFWQGFLKIYFLLPILSLPLTIAVGSNDVLGVLMRILLHRDPLITV